MSGRSSRGKKLKKAVLELYPERRRFLEVIQTECLSEFNNLIAKLCQKYSELYVSCHGKDSYVKLQIKWHNYIRSVAITGFIYKLLSNCGKGNTVLDDTCVCTISLSP